MLEMVRRHGRGRGNKKSSDADKDVSWHDNSQRIRSLQGKGPIRDRGGGANKEKDPSESDIGG